MRTFFISFNNKSLSVDVPEEAVQYYIDYAKSFNNKDFILAISQESLLHNSFFMELWMKNEELFFLLLIQMKYDLKLNIENDA